MIKVVSFDLDGTLVDWSFTDAFWFDCIPRLYAQRWGLGQGEALKEVRRQYDEAGLDRLEWYDIGYWWARFDLPGDWKQLLKECRSKVRAYPDALPALEALRGKYRLIVISNATRELAEVEVEHGGLKGYIKRVFSATSDFKVVKKTGEFYLQVLKEIGVTPVEVVHVGDNYAFDYMAAREAGIRAYFLDRSGKHSGSFVVKDLKEFAQKLVAK